MTDAPRPRDSARAFLYDGEGRLVLIRRTRPGLASYLVTPGGGVEAGEETAAAAARECAEELGAEVLVGPVVVVSPPDPAGTATYHLAIVDHFDDALRTGHELREPERGTYETVRVDWRDPEAVATLRPDVLRDLLAQYGEAWAGWAEAAFRG